MQKLAVVHFPKINTNEIDIFRKKYDLGYKIISPHITIVSPISELSEIQIIEHIESKIKNVNSFTIHLKDLIKTPDSHLFLQLIEGNDTVVRLHDQLYSGILTPYLPTDFSFSPHITLGYFGETSDLFKQAYIEAQRMNLDFKSEFNNLSIIKGDGLSPAVIVKTITLQE